MPRLQPDPLNLPLPIKVTSPFAVKIVKTSRLRQICQAVYRAVGKTFSLMGCSKGLDRLFNSQEMRLLRDDRHALLSTPQATLPAKKVIQPRHLSSVANTPIVAENPTPQSKRGLSYVKFDDTLENGRAVIRDVSLLTLDIIHENSFEPMIESIQQMAPSIPPLVKSVAKLIIEMGDKAAKPLFKKLAERKTEVIDPAIHAILKTLIKIDSNNLRSDLFKHLQGQMEGVVLPAGQKPLHYIKPIMKRLFPKTRPSPLETNGITKEITLDAKLMEELFAKAQAFYRGSNAADLEKLYNRLLHRLSQDLQEVKIPKGQDLTKDYIKPTLDWLLHSDFSTPIADLFIPSENFDGNLIDKVFEMTITILVEKKIDHYVNFLDRTLQRRLGDIIHNMILVNTVNIANYFSGRFAEMMMHFPYTETYDKITSDVIAKQIEGFIIAKEARKNHKKLLEKSRKAVKLEAFSQAEVKAKARAEKHLASVEQHGGEEAFLNNMFLEAFSKQKCCNPNVLQIIEQHLNNTLQQKDPQNAIRAIEQSFFASISDEIMNLMLPTRKKRREDGIVEETEALVELWNQLYLPPEFLELMKHVSEIANEFITPDTASLFASIKDPLMMVTQKFSITLAQDMLKKQLTLSLQKCFEMMTNPDDLNELSAETILPTVNELLLGIFIRQEIGRNISKLTPLFHDLINAVPANHKVVYKKIQEAMLLFSKAKFHEFQGKAFYVTEVTQENEAKLKIDDLQKEGILQIINPIIDDIEKLLVEKKQESTRPVPSLDRKEVTAIIKKFFDSGVTVKKEDIYGDIFMNIIFKIGGWKNENLIGYFIKDTLSQTISYATADLRYSYHFLISTVFEVMKRVMLDRPRMERLLGSGPAYVPRFTAEKLKLQTDTLARILYDMITELAGDKGTIAKFSTKKFIYNDSKAINQLTTKIYHRILGNKILNQNLLMQIIEEIFHSFRISAQAIRAKEGILIQKPTVIT